MQTSRVVFSQKISAVDAANQLGVRMHTIFAYLKNNRLAGVYETGEVFEHSILDYRKRRVPSYDAVCQALTRDNLTDRQRDILTRRTEFQTLAEIGAAVDPPVTKSRVAAIIRRLLKG